MPTAAERQALLFLLGITLLGGGVRLWAGAAPLPPGGGLAGPEGGAPPRAPGVGDTAGLRRQRAAVASARQERGRAGGGTAGGARPRREGAPPSRPGVATEPVHVNTATAPELERLPRVGPTLARRILADRAALGPYRSLEELGRVPGIGPATLRRLAPVVTFSPRPSPYPDGDPGRLPRPPH